MPCLTLHDRCVSALTYSVDRHRPPRDVAISTITSKDRRATCAQCGHHRPPFTSPGAASHSWPAAHLQRNFVSLFTYRSERHSPPRRSAKARISPSVSRFLCAHSGHQLPLLTLVGIAFHRCPSLHLQDRGVRESTYRRERHVPLRRLASLRISERVDLRMAEMTTSHPHERAGGLRLATKWVYSRGVPTALIVRSGTRVRSSQFAESQSVCR